MNIRLSLVLVLMIQSTHLGKNQRMDLFWAHEGFESFKSKYLPELLIPEPDQIASDNSGRAGTIMRFKNCIWVLHYEKPN